MSRKRLSKKQLRRDKFVEQTFDWAHWIETHRRQALVAAGVLVLLLAGFVVWRQMSRSAEETASIEYVQARQAYYAGNWQLATSDIQGFLSRYGSSSYADDARLVLADAYFRAGAYTQAIEAADELISQHRGSPLVVNARRIQGAAYEQLQQYPQATAIYQRGLEAAADDETRIGYHEALARVYAAQGQVGAAANQYRSVAQLDPDGERGRQARLKIAELSTQPIPVGGTVEAPAEGEAEPAGAGS